ncbi:hypothetical protein [Paracoccus sp. IB05]|uniref:hypothetical protein n=1 Tax=Paracoccus sp. IB05 TaxID=2779367 RepID=UPI0018E83619|nr:hypothetical protein [Paracoccus sp. IB05]MBJ2153172.1 hypothetical protein [Paracoccus sp. IB05]
MRMLCLAASLATIACPTLAQTPITGDLTVTIEPERYRICNDRPARPAWVEEIAPREAYKVLTLMGLYELRSWEAILASKDCSCETRFPEWALAEAEYTERFADISAPEHTQAQQALREQAGELRQAVKAICEAQDNW